MVHNVPERFCCFEFCCVYLVNSNYFSHCCCSVSVGCSASVSFITTFSCTPLACTHRASVTPSLSLSRSLSVISVIFVLPIRRALSRSLSLSRIVASSSSYRYSVILLSDSIPYCWWQATAVYRRSEDMSAEYAEKPSSSYVRLPFSSYIRSVRFAWLCSAARRSLFLHWQCGRKTWKKISHKSTHTTVFDDFHRNSERIGWRETAEAWNHTKQMTLSHELARTFTMSALVASAVHVLVSDTRLRARCLCTCTVGARVCVCPWAVQRRVLSGRFARTHTHTHAYTQRALMRRAECQRRSSKRDGKNIHAQCVAIYVHAYTQPANGEEWAWLAWASERYAGKGDAHNQTRQRS